AHTHKHTHTHSLSHIYLQTVITSEVQLSFRTPPLQNNNCVRRFEMRSVLFSPKSRPKISSQRLLLCNQDKDTECCLYFHTVFLDACVGVCVCGCGCACVARCVCAWVCGVVLVFDFFVCVCVCVYFFV